MKAFGLIETMKRQKKALGMTNAVIASRSGLSEPTVVRILSGHAGAHFDHVLAIAKVLGVDLNARTTDPEKILKRQAHYKAEMIMRLVRGNSALEATETDAGAYRSMLRKTVRELLGGSRRALWG